MKLKQHFFQLALEQQIITKTKKTEHTKLTGGTAATLPSMKNVHHELTPGRGADCTPQGGRGKHEIETNIVTSCCINLCSNQNIAVWGPFPRQGQKN